MLKLRDNYNSYKGVFTERFQVCCVYSVSASESEHEVDGGFLLDVVVSEASAVFEALATEDQSLLVSGDTLLVLDLGLHGLNGVVALAV